MNQDPISTDVEHIDGPDGEPTRPAHHRDASLMPVGGGLSVPSYSIVEAGTENAAWVGGSSVTNVGGVKRPQTYKTAVSAAGQ